MLNFILKAFKRKGSEHHIPAYELRVVKIYAPIMLSATIFSILFFAFFGLPIFVLIFVEGLSMVLAGIQGNSMVFAEGLILSFLIGVQIFGFVFFVVRSSLRCKARLSVRQEYG
jgi:hypothetical protein